MNKDRLVLVVIQLIIAAIGCYLIGDIKITIGVIAILWANNFNYVKKDKIEDS
jgi:hypothetical protein